MSIGALNSGYLEYTQNEAAKKDPLSLKEAIKAYNDEYLTGLTDEEKEEIAKEAKKYLKSIEDAGGNIDDKPAKDAYKEFMKALLKKYGYKGNIDDHAETMGGIIMDEYKKSKAAAENNSQDAHNAGTAPGISKNIMNGFQVTKQASISMKNKIVEELMYSTRD